MALKASQDRSFVGSTIIRALLVFLVVSSAGLVIFKFFLAEKDVQNPGYEDQVSVVQPLATPAEDDVAENDVPPTLDFDAELLQSTLDTWYASLRSGGRASVVIAKDDGSVLAAVNQQELYFTASIYKLFVAYEGYRKVDAGELDPAVIFLNDMTLEQCLDLMIRDSNSPCAEKLWVQLGKDWLTDQVKSYGIEDTSLTGLSTTARDSASMAAMIARGEGLSVESQQKYLDSMKDQEAKYRRGLPSGFSDSVIVYNKVGWNEQLEYHDVSIVELPDGRSLVVAVLTSSVGASKISELARSLEPVISFAE